MFSCSNEERNRLPSITPSHIDLSLEHPEASFQIACGDYNMYGFIIVGQEEYRITKEIMSTEVTVAVSYTHLETVCVFIDFANYVFNFMFR